MAQTRGQNSVRSQSARCSRSTHVSQRCSRVYLQVSAPYPLQSTTTGTAGGVLDQRAFEIFVARGGTAELTNTILTADEVRDLVERMLKSSGRRVDLSSLFVDATLPDGSRLHVVIPDITQTCPERLVRVGAERP
jgi:Flp pilus assembly CpaF family ATPase